jgi:hypothetical protein
MTRRPITRQALTAAYRAHQATPHPGDRCPVCASYLHALTATTQEPQP